MLYVILKNTDLALVYRDKIDSVGFMSKFRGEIYEGLLKQLDAGSKSAADKLFTELSNEAATELAQIMTKDLAEENGEKLVDDCLRQMRRGAPTNMNVWGMTAFCRNLRKARKLKMKSKNYIKKQQQILSNERREHHG